MVEEKWASCFDLATLTFDIAHDLTSDFQGQNLTNTYHNTTKWAMLNKQEVYLAIYMTVGQCHRKVIQDTIPDLFFLCGNADWYGMKGCDSNINDHDLWVTMVGWLAVHDNDCGDLRRQLAAKTSSFQNIFLFPIVWPC